MLDVMRFWLDLGVDGFRADAVPYLFEREGTNCENLPETHAYLKEVRRFLNENYPHRILLAEANQWPEDVLPYFGDGSDEFHMGFHFPLMPRIFMALRKADRSPLTWVLERTPALPPGCQWCTFLRNHDELTLEMVTDDDRQWMWREYAPQPCMRLNLGIRRRLAPLLDNDQRKIELANSLLFTLPGSPTLYYGDEIGMGDNIRLPDRNGVRTPMQWNGGPNAGFSQAPPDKLYAPLISNGEYASSKVNVESQKANPTSLLNRIRGMVMLRKQNPAFGWGDFKWVDCPTNAVAAYLRSYQKDHLWVINNLSATTRSVELRLPYASARSAVDLFAGEELPVLDGARIPLAMRSYQYRWVKLNKD